MAICTSPCTPASAAAARGQGAAVFEWITNLAIGLLFFMHGAKLSGSAILAGMGHWRLHLLVFSCTFVLFPLLGLALRPLLTPMIGAERCTPPPGYCRAPAM